MKFVIIFLSNFYWPIVHGLHVHLEIAMHCLLVACCFVEMQRATNPFMEKYYLGGNSFNVLNKSVC